MANLAAVHTVLPAATGLYSASTGILLPDLHVALQAYRMMHHACAACVLHAHMFGLKCCSSVAATLVAILTLPIQLAMQHL